VVAGVDRGLGAVAQAEPAEDVRDVALYMLGLTAAALRTTVPEPIYLSGLAIGSVAVFWLSLALSQASEKELVRA